MISLVDLSRSADPFGPQSAATPASSSGPLPPASKSGQQTDAAHPTNDVSISAEGVRQLQRASQLEEEQAATRKAVGQDPDLAARMAHEMAYRREVVVVPSTAYSNYPTSLYISGTSPTSKAANIAKAQAEVDNARMARIALYEYEKARGTAPAEIYDRLLGLSASQSSGSRITIAS
jgi:hypothetical protein